MSRTPQKPWCCCLSHGPCPGCLPCELETSKLGPLLGGRCSRLGKERQQEALQTAKESKEEPLTPEVLNRGDEPPRSERGGATAPVSFTPSEEGQRDIGLRGGVEVSGRTRFEGPSKILQFNGKSAEFEVNFPLIFHAIFRCPF